MSGLKALKKSLILGTMSGVSKTTPKPSSLNILKRGSMVVDKADSHAGIMESSKSDIAMSE